MIRDRVLDLTNDTEQELFFDENGWPVSSAEFEQAARETTGYVCPECGKPTFGKFEPFIERGIIAWCSSCGHQVVDKARYLAWQELHKQDYAPITTDE